MKVHFDQTSHANIAKFNTFFFAGLEDKFIITTLVEGRAEFRTRTFVSL